MKNHEFIVAVLLCLISMGCYKDLDNSQQPVTIIEVPDTKINTTVYGVVNDEDGNSIDNFSISVNDNNFAVEQDIFKLELNQVNKRNQHISIIKDDQEIAFANVSLIENDYNKLVLKTFPKWAESSSLNAGSAFIAEDQYEVKLLENQLTNNNAISYGVIQDETVLHQMGLWARGSDNDNFYLNPISAFYYKNNQENLISVTHHGASNSGDMMGLFHLDENFHQWVLKDKFTTTKKTIDTNNDGYYMLANFSASTFVEGRISYSELPVSYQDITLETSIGQSTYIKASANGRWSSFVPNESLTKVSIINPCGELIYTDEEVFDKNSEVHLTQLNSSNANGFLPLSFKNIDCFAKVTVSPGVKLDYGIINDVLLYGEQKVETIISTCGEILIEGYDIESNMTGTSIKWSANIDDELGVLSACDATQSGYSYIKINGEEELLPKFALSINSGEITLSAPDGKIRIKIKGTEIGKYQENQVNIYIEDENFGKDGYLIKCENSEVGCGIDDCYISHLENMSNGLSRVTFSGKLWMQTINNPTAGNYPIEGQIIIKQ